MNTQQWSSRPGFLLATIGAAVGLGNIWRFSAVVGQNGGGAYLVPYLLAVVVCALPLLVLELTVGRTLQTDVVSAFRSVNPRYTILGWIVITGVLLILSYYLVLTGWVLGFLVNWGSGGGMTFQAFTGSWAPVGYFILTTAITGGVVSLGIRSGIERLAKLVMPTVFVLLVMLALYAATLPGWSAGAAFLFTPDLSALREPGLWGAAFGQAFFSLSVGQGIILTYGSYLDAETKLLSSATIITAADLMAAFIAGLVIFPIVFTFDLAPTLGTELAFTTLPTAFASMPFGRVTAIGFFALLFFAALSSAVSLLEVGIATTTRLTRLERSQATLGVTGSVFVLGLFSAMSYSPVNLAIGQQRVLDLIDESVGTFALPISALLMIFVFVWQARTLPLQAELGPLLPFVRYLVPAVLLITTGLKLVGLGRPAWRVAVNETGAPTLLSGVLALVTIVLVGGLAFYIRKVTRR